VEKDAISVPMYRTWRLDIKEPIVVRALRGCCIGRGEFDSTQSSKAICDDGRKVSRLLDSPYPAMQHMASTSIVSNMMSKHYCSGVASS
jgi:hypothetical protein